MTTTLPTLEMMGETGFEGNMTCPDCPLTNPNPPKRSDCKDFDGTYDPAECLRPNGMVREVSAFLSGTVINITPVEE